MTVDPTSLDTMLKAETDVKMAQAVPDVLPPLSPDPVQADKEAVTEAAPVQEAMLRPVGTVTDALPEDAMPQSEDVGFIKKAVSAAAKAAGRAENAVNAVPGEVTKEGKYLVLGISDEAQGQKFFDEFAKAPVTGKPPMEALNIDRIQSTDDVKKAIGAVSEAFDIKAGTVTFDEMKAMADQVGLDEKWVSRVVMRPDGELIPGYKDALALRQLVVSSGSKLEELAKVAATSTDEAVLLEFRQQLALQGTLQRTLKGVQSDVARTLASFRIPAEGNRAQDVSNLVASMGGADNTRDLAHAFLSLDTRARANFAEGSFLSKVKDVWFETWINGLLSGPQTHAYNIASNLAFAALNTVERGVAWGIGGVRTGIMRVGGLTPAERVTADEVQAMAGAWGQGMKEGLSLASKSFVQGYPESNVSTKIDRTRKGSGGEMRAFSSENFGMEPGFMAQMVDYIGVVQTAPTRALMSEDEFFKGMAYRIQLNALAARRGSELAKAGKTEAEITKELGDFLSNPPGEIKASAKEFADTLTFTRELEPSLGKVYGALQNPVAKLFVPFVKTPTNIAMEAMSRTPVFPLSPRFLADFKKGGIDRDIAMAKASTGNGIIFGLSQLVPEGVLTGYGPDKPDDRKALERTGWMPHSFAMDRSAVSEEQLAQFRELVGPRGVSVGQDKVYIPYDRFDPISPIIAVAANIGEYGMYADDDVGGMQKVFVGGTMAIYKYMGEQAMLQGVADMVKAVSNRETDGADKLLAILRQAQKQAGDFVIGGTPVAGPIMSSGMTATIDRWMNGNPKKDTRAGDDDELQWTRLDMADHTYLKGVFESLQKMRSRNPFFSDDVPDKTDLWGNPIKAKAGAFYNPGAGERPVSNADAVIIGLGLPLAEPDRKWQGVEMTADQHNRLKYLAGTEIRDGEGRNVQDVIAALPKTPGWHLMSTLNKQEFVKSMYSGYLSIARDMVLKEYPSLAAQIDANQRKLDLYGR